jgi:hypothetical protein
MNQFEDAPKDPVLAAHLGMELGLIMQIKFFDSGEEFKGMIVGMERGFYFILRTPPVEDWRERLGVEDNIIVRYSFRGTTYGFVSSLTAYIDHPMQLAVFAYPREIQTINLRYEDRVPCFVPSSITIDGQSYRGYISNISTNGCLFLLDLPGDKTMPNISSGQETSITVHLPGLAGKETIKATVCSIRKEEKEVNLGIQFINMDTHILSDVKGFIKNIQKFKNVRKSM